MCIGNAAVGGMVRALQAQVKQSPLRVNEARGWLAGKRGMHVRMHARGQTGGRSGVRAARQLTRNPSLHDLTLHCDKR